MPTEARGGGETGCAPGNQPAAKLPFCPAARGGGNPVHAAGIKPVTKHTKGHEGDASTKACNDMCAANNPCHRPAKHYNGGAVADAYDSLHASQTGLSTPAADGQRRQSSCTDIVLYQRPLLTECLWWLTSYSCQPCALGLRMGHKLSATLIANTLNVFTDAYARDDYSTTVNTTYYVNLPADQTSDADPDVAQVHDDLDHTDMPRSRSPIGVAEFSDVELPALVDMSTDSSSYESSTEDEFSDDDWDLPLLTQPNHGGVHHAYMQRAAASGVAEVVVVNMDLLSSRCTFIVHQTNCVSRTAHGLARAVFERFPHADCYTNRTRDSWPGSVQVCGDDRQRRVINLHGQFYPGRPQASGVDTTVRRLNYFVQGLEAIERHIGLMPQNEISLAFPAEIGCGFGGGDWPTYEHAIREFADEASEVTGKFIRVHICRKPVETAPEHTGLRPVASGKGGEPTGDLRPNWGDGTESAAPSPASKDDTQRTPARNAAPRTPTDNALHVTSSDSECPGLVSASETSDDSDSSLEDSDSDSSDEFGVFTERRTPYSTRDSNDTPATPVRDTDAGRTVLPPYIGNLIDLTMSPDPHDASRPRRAVPVPSVTPTHSVNQSEPRQCPSTSNHHARTSGTVRSADCAASAPAWDLQGSARTDDSACGRLGAGHFPANPREAAPTADLGIGLAKGCSCRQLPAQIYTFLLTFAKTTEQFRWQSIEIT